MYSKSVWSKFYGSCWCKCVKCDTLSSEVWCAKIPCAVWMACKCFVLWDLFWTTSENCQQLYIYWFTFHSGGGDHQGKAGMIVKISSSIDTLLFLRNYLDQQYKVFTIHLEIKLLWCSLIIFQIPDHLSQGGTYKSCILHSAAIGLVWHRFPRLCSDLWIVRDGLCSLLFLALAPYKVKELCRHHHHHHHCHDHHHYYHSFCTEAMKSSSMHCVNNGM